MNQQEKVYEMLNSLGIQPEKLKEEAENNVNAALANAEKICKHRRLDGFVLCSES